MLFSQNIIDIDKATRSNTPPPVYTLLAIVKISWTNEKCSNPCHSGTGQATTKLILHVKLMLNYNNRILQIYASNLRNTKTA